MKLRILGIATLAVFVMAMAVSAAPVSSVGRPHPLLQMGKQLGLTQTQIGQIRDIIKSFNADAKSIRTSSVAPAQKRIQLKNLRDTTLANINGVLTADQQTKATQMHFAEKVLAIDRAEPLLKALTQLNLSETQKTAIKGIMKESEAQAKAIRSDASLAQPARAAKLKALRQDTISQVKGQLSSDQLAKFQQMMAANRKR